VAIVGAGCAKQDDGALSAGEARAAGDALGNGIEDAAATYGPMRTAGADTSCITLGGDSSDPDGDAIPVGATLTYDCTSEALGYVGRLTGTQAVVDDQPAALAWAFSATADMHASLTGPGGATITSDWDGGIVGSQASAAGPYALERVLDVVTTFTGGGDAGRITATVTEDNDWTVTFTPQVSWTPGAVVVTGSLAATGTWNVTVGEKTRGATLSTPTPLTIDPACETLVTAGVAVGTYPLVDDGTGTITVTWTGCGARAVTLLE
jgi:hypothetical protein